MLVSAPLFVGLSLRLWLTSLRDPGINRKTRLRLTVVVLNQVLPDARATVAMDTGRDECPQVRAPDRTPRNEPPDASPIVSSIEDIVRLSEGVRPNGSGSTR
jgi:hypothetical protein